MFFYFSGASAYLIFLLVRFAQDTETSKKDSTSWLVMFIAVSLWFVVIPISIWEITSKAKAQAKLDAMPKPMNFGQNARHIKVIKQVEIAEKRTTEDKPIFDS